MLCKRCIVSGRVQGVYYRGSTQKVAQKLGVTGSAINRSDGTVEVVACGEEDAVNQLEQWLWQGSDWANVSHVECEVLQIQPTTGFITRQNRCSLCSKRGSYFPVAPLPN